MSALRIIGIVGVAGSGKILVADHLLRQHKYERLRFADCKKDALLRDTNRGDTQNIPSTLSASAWAQQADAMSAGALIVADDIRYPTEAEAVKRAGGVIWRVIRPGLVSRDTVTERTQTNIKEDVLINNATTIEALLASVDLLVSQKKENANV
jgi:hypothetical protein